MDKPERRAPAKYEIRIGDTVVKREEVALIEDRTHRASWNLTGSVIGVDMGNARVIWRDKLRAARKPLLEALDVQFIRAVETGALTSVIADRKRALRDVTADPRIDAAQTPDELKALTLDVLIGN